MKNESLQDTMNVQKIPEPEAPTGSPEPAPCLLTWKDAPHRVKRQIDLSPLRSVIEFDGLKSLVRTLRDTHHDYAAVLINNELNSETSFLDEACANELFALKCLADALDEVREVSTSPY